MTWDRIQYWWYPDHLPCSNSNQKVLDWHQPRCNTVDYSCNDRHWRKSNIYKHVPLLQYSEESSLIIKRAASQRFCLTSYLHLFFSLHLEYFKCLKLWKSLRKVWVVLNSPNHFFTEETPESVTQVWMLIKQISREISFCIQLISGNMPFFVVFCFVVWGILTNMIFSFINTKFLKTKC